MVHTRAHRAAVYTTRDETTGCTTEAPLGPRQAHHIQGSPKYAVRDPMGPRWAPHATAVMGLQDTAPLGLKRVPLGPGGRTTCNALPYSRGRWGAPARVHYERPLGPRWAHHTTVVERPPAVGPPSPDGRTTLEGTPGPPGPDWYIHHTGAARVHYKGPLGTRRAHHTTVLEGPPGCSISGPGAQVAHHTAVVKGSAGCTISPPPRDHCGRTTPL